MLTFLKRNVGVLGVLFFSSWMYVYHVHYTALSSWDEAWYGAIAREILITGDWMTLHFNGVPFYDHPPMGFWIMATFYKLFGVTELTTRLPSVIAGIGTCIFIYKLGESLFKKKMIGLIASIILSTCVWYVLRVRSGNLDALFLFFYVATVYYAYLTTKSFKWFPLCGLFFGALVMTKTLAGVSAAIIILWFIFPYIFKSKWNIVYLALGIGLFSIIVIPWYRYHLLTNTSFYQYHFVHIGARDKEFSLQNYAHLTWELPLFYLHMGVRKWYDPWLISLGIVCLTITIQMIQSGRAFLTKKKYENWEQLHHLLGLIGWNMVVLLPFLTTDKTEIWHLIPTYAPLALIIAYGSYMALEWSIFVVKKVQMPYVLAAVSNTKVMAGLYILPFLLIAFLQIKTFYLEVFPTTKYIVDEVDILQKAKKYGKTVFIDRDFVPVAVFYSQQRVKEQSRYASDTETVQNFIDQPDEAVLVTKNSAVAQYLTTSSQQVKILEKNSSYSIIAER